MALMLDAQRSGINSLAKLGEGVRTNSDAKTQAGLSRGANQSKKLNNAAWTNTFPAQGATLDLDFANDRGYVRGVGQGKSMDAVTFTRASNGNYVKPDGTLSSHANQGALGNNLLTFPQDFDNAAWVKNGCTVTSKATVAPDGNQTALALVVNSGAAVGNGVERSLPIVSSVAYVWSLYVKAELNTICYLDAYDGSNRRTWFNLTGAGSVLTNAAGNTASIVALSGGWFRLILTRTAGSTVGYFAFGAASSDGVITAAGTGSANIFIWGAQLEVGASPTEYFPTNINQPRFDWASTVQLKANLLTYTEQFDNAAWTKQAGHTVIANQEIAPDGTLTADLIIGNNSSNGVFQGVVGVNGTVLQNTKSVYIKVASGTATVRIQDPAQTIGNTVCNLTTEWQRFTLTETQTATGGFQCGIWIYQIPATGIFVWGAQVEAASVATSYKANGAQIPSSTSLAANSTSNGLLIEESRANRILWCRDATQTNWTKTNITATKNQTGVDGVTNSASSLTATSANGTCIQTITLASGSRTGSVFLKRITGTGTVQVTLDGSTYSTVDLSASEWRRIVLRGTVTNPTVGIKIVTNGDAVAMDYGQVEDGAFATSPILTTTASVTRAIDLGTLNTDVWLDPKQGTFYTSALGIGRTTFNTNALIIGNTTNGVVVDRGGASEVSVFRPTIYLNNVAVFDNNGTYGLLNNDKYEIVMAYNAAGASVSILGNNASGVSGVNESRLSAIPTTMLTLTISSNRSRWLKRIIYFPLKLNNTVLQQWSAV